LRAGNAFALRFANIDAAPLPDAGRHFSSVDPGTRLETKLSRVFHTEWGGPRETRPEHLRRCRAHGVHHRGWWYAERPDGPLPDDVRRLADQLNDKHTGAPFPRFWRRRLVRTWAWVRLWRFLPERMVEKIDRHFDRVLPFAAVPLMAADLVRGFIAASKPRASA
jgi:beta-1,4-mannosyl-glycoprotein beta-1,4-N-acetylglucosaminyltransferase